MSNLDMALRKQGVTGSEIAAVAGLSPYAGPMEIWARKLDMLPPKTVTPDMHRGNRLEPALCQWAAEEYGLYGEDVGTLQCAEHPLVIASPDRILHRTPELNDPVAVLEVKAPARTQHHWTDPDIDKQGIDQQYLPQVTWEMAASGLQSVLVGALCYGQMWTYTLDFDEELFGLLHQVAEKFWRDHVETRTPPPVSSGADAGVLKHLYPTQREPLAEAGPGVADMVAEWRELDAMAKRAAQFADTAKAHVMAAIGEQEGYAGEGWKVTWRQGRPRKVVDWKAIADSLGGGLPEEQFSGIIDRHTTEKPGARVLRYYGKGRGK